MSAVSPAAGTPTGVIRDAWRMLVNNYFALAGVALVAFVATVLVFLLNIVPVLGQVFSAFLLSLVIGLAFLVALEIGRRTPAPVNAVLNRLSLNRVVELSVVLLPIGILTVLAGMATALWIAMLPGVLSPSFGMRGGSGTPILFGVSVVILLILYAYFRAWIVVKVLPSATYVLAAPRDAAIAPLTRLRQGWALSRGRAGGFAVRFWFVVALGMLIDLVPLIGFSVGRVLFTDPFIFAGAVVIYHRLIARALPGLQPRARTEADAVAEQAGPY